MKRLFWYYFFALLLFLPLTIVGQSSNIIFEVPVSIDQNGSDNHPSAIMDIKASDKGVLIPRVALSDLKDGTTIPSPANGLLIYNTNVVGVLEQGFYYWENNCWNHLITLDMIDDADADPTNELQDWTTLPGIPAGFSDDIDDVDDADADSTNEIQVLMQTGNDVTLSNGGGMISVADNDNDSANELQTLDQTGLNVTLSNGGGIISVADFDNNPINELQNWTILPGIPSGFADNVDDVDDADANPTNELQTISQTGTDVTLSDGGGTFSIIDNDNDSSNELQNWSNLPGIPAGFSDDVDDIDDADANPTNEIQILSQIGNDVTLSDGGGMISVSDGDDDPNNEFLTSAMLNGTILELAESTNSVSVDLAPIVGAGTPNVYSSTLTNGSVTATSTFTNSGLSVSFTPSGASSKVVIQYHLNGYNSDNNGGLVGIIDIDGTISEASRTGTFNGSCNTSDCLVSVAGVLQTNLSGSSAHTIKVTFRNMLSGTVFVKNGSLVVTEY